ncbi:hypothetical protein [Gordonibacter sp.]|uniref:hypothetical protein n=1 Tax=Gordonibacter sp. TaxID=1968902 RepID=UPI002FC787A0
MISRRCRVALAVAAVLTMCAVLPLLEVPPEQPEYIPCDDRLLLTERQKAEARATGYASFMTSDSWHVEHISNLTDYI